MQNTEAPGNATLPTRKNSKLGAKLFHFFFVLMVTVCMIQFPNRAFGAWEKVRNLPPQVASTYLLDVYFLRTNTQYGWACGYNGHVLRTTDGGSTWLFSSTPVPFQAESIVFVDQTNGYISGDDLIFKSTNGGASWTQLTVGKNQRIWGCAFYDKSNGVAVGGGCNSDRKFYRTTNGGSNWTVFTSTGESSGLSDAVIYADGLGYAVSSGMIWRTDNYGDSWNIISDMTHRNWQEDIAVCNHSILIPASNGCSGTGFGDGAIYFSTDLGNSWRSFDKIDKMYGSFLTSDTTGWAVGKNRSVYHTRDAGTTWELDNCGIDDHANIDDCFFFDDSTGFIVGNGIYYHTNVRTQSLSIRPNSDTTLCEGQSLVIRSEKQYQGTIWSDGSFGDSIIITRSGEYYLRGISDCDSSHSDTVRVQFLPSAQISVTASSKVICPGSSVMLFAQHSVPIEWSTGETNDTIYVSSPGVYFAKAKDTHICSYWDSVAIVANPDIRPTIRANGRTKFCTGSDVLLSVQQRYFAYSWASTANPSAILSDKDTLRVLANGDYFVIVTDSNQCVWQSDTVSVRVLDATNSIRVIDSDEPSAIDCGSLGVYGIVCQQIHLINESDREIILPDANAAINVQFSVPQSRFPLSLKPHEVDSIVVCFSPLSIGKFTDSVRIDDICSSWFLHFRGEGIANEMTGESGCGSDYILSDYSQRKALAVSAIAPQPATDRISITISGTENRDARVFVYNLAGECVRSTANYEHLGGKQSVANIDLYGLPVGVYSIQILSPTSHTSSFFIKE